VTMSIDEQIINKFEQLSRELQTDRDKIKLQLHLLNMDAKEDWNELEKKYEQFKAKSSTVSGVAEDSAGNVAEALKLVADELHEGYKRIKKSF
jgi:chromosome segregation ATPase